MPNRHGQDDDYRYGYQGSESDDEVHGTKGSSYTTHFRQLDTRIGRWLSIDPMEAKFPWQSPYVSMDNNPVSFNDPLGDKADDIILDINGEEQERIKNDKPDRYFVENNEIGNYSYKKSKFIQVRSPESLKGDIKDKNKWNGKTVKVEGEFETKLDKKVEKAVEKINNNFQKPVGLIKESMQGGEADFVKEFEDGILYNIDGIYYNSHEALNYYWGATMYSADVDIVHSAAGAKFYHAYAYLSKDKYKDVGISEELGHLISMYTGYFNYKEANRGEKVTFNYGFIGGAFDYSLFNLDVQTR